MSAPRGRVLVAVHSRTGVSARLAREAARALGRRGFEVRVAALRPRRNLPYLLWLLLSFLPGCRFPAAPLAEAPERFDALLLLFPKWTFADPVANDFLARSDAKRLPPVGLLVACGGWDAERYAKRYAATLIRRGVTVLGWGAIRRRTVGAGESSAPVEAHLSEWFREN